MVGGGTMKANRDDWIKQINFFKLNCQAQLVNLPKINWEIANIKAGGV